MYMTIIISDNINNLYYNNCDLAWKNHTCCAKMFQPTVAYIHLLHGPFVHDAYQSWYHRRSVIKYLDSEVGKHPVQNCCIANAYMQLFSQFFLGATLNVALKCLPK